MSCLRPIKEDMLPLMELEEAEENKDKFSDLYSIDKISVSTLTDTIDSYYKLIEKISLGVDEGFSKKSFDKLLKENDKYLKDLDNKESYLGLDSKDTRENILASLEFYLQFLEDYNMNEEGITYKPSFDDKGDKVESVEYQIYDKSTSHIIDYLNSILDKEEKDDHELDYLISKLLELAQSYYSLQDYTFFGTTNLDNPLVYLPSASLEENNQGPTELAYKPSKLHSYSYIGRLKTRYKINGVKYSGFFSDSKKNLLLHKSEDKNYKIDDFPSYKLDK